MKNIDRVKNHFLAKNGYYYEKKDEPDYSSPEIDFLLNAEIEHKLDRLEQHTETIKKIMLVFVALNIASFVIAILTALNFF